MDRLEAVQPRGQRLAIGGRAAGYHRAASETERGVVLQPVGGDDRQPGEQVGWLVRSPSARVWAPAAS